MTAPEPPGGTDAAAWQPLPLRARGLFRLHDALWMSLLGMAIVVGAWLLARDISASWALPAAAVVVWAALTAWGAWWGGRRWANVAWRLDATGLSVRRGRLWQSEGRVPRSRVQHLDLKRGPLERRRDLATLVVHTAGVSQQTVTVPHLQAAQAEHLRDVLARQVEHDPD